MTSAPARRRRDTVWERMPPSATSRTRARRSPSIDAAFVRRSQASGARSWPLTPSSREPEHHAVPKARGVGVANRRCRARAIVEPSGRTATRGSPRSPSHSGTRRRAPDCEGSGNRSGTTPTTQPCCAQPPPLLGEASGVAGLAAGVAPARTIRASSRAEIRAIRRRGARAVGTQEPRAGRVRVPRSAFCAPARHRRRACAGPRRGPQCRRFSEAPTPRQGGSPDPSAFMGTDRRKRPPEPRSRAGPIRWPMLLPRSSAPDAAASPGAGHAMFG
jgi:hypothetical protein